MFFIMDPLNLIKEKANDLIGINNTVNQPPKAFYDCSSDVYNCSNFTTQAEAQSLFDFCVNEGSGDIHQIDSDGDGLACEGLA